MNPIEHPLIPMGDRIVVHPKSTEGKSRGGIDLPDTVRDGEKMRPQEGEVVAIGPGRVLDNGERVPIDPRIQVGGRVIYTKYAGSAVHLEDDVTLIISEREVLAVLRDGAVAEIRTETPMKDHTIEGLKFARTER